MDNKPKNTPKDFFIYFGVMLTLYVSVGAVLALWFSYIDFLYPDQLYAYYDFYSSSIRSYIAMLLIIFPAFMALSWYASKQLIEAPEKRELPVRKWLLFLTLFVAVASVLGDMVALIDTFLGGELTTRFILKVLAVLVVAGSVVAYYGLDLRGVTARKPKILRFFTIGAALAILMSMVAGFFITGTPSTQRGLRFDQTRIMDLQSIQWQIVTYWQQKDVLPVKLSDLNDPITNYSVPHDPETGAEYVYKNTGGRSFSLCSTFVKDGGSNSAYAYPKAIGVMDGDNWQHTPGYQCFERTIDPDRYPPIKR